MPVGRGNVSAGRGLSQRPSPVRLFSYGAICALAGAIRPAENMAALDGTALQPSDCTYFPMRQALEVQGETTAKSGVTPRALQPGGNGL